MKWNETLQLWRPRLTVVSYELYSAVRLGTAAEQDYVAFIEHILQFSDKMIWLGANRAISRHCAHSPCLRDCGALKQGTSRTSLVLAGNIPVADLGFVIPPGVGLYKNEVWKRGRCANAYPWQLYMPIAQPGRASAVNRPSGSGDCCCVNCRSEGNFRFLHTRKEHSHVRTIRLGAENAIQEATRQPQLQGMWSSVTGLERGPACVSALPLQAEHPSSKSPLTLRQWPPTTTCRFIR